MLELYSATHLIAIVLFLGLLSTTFSIADHPTLGPADLTVKDFTSCEDPDLYPTTLEVFRRKINRTFESFTVRIKMNVDLDPTVGIDVNVAKWGDGGFKPNYLIVNHTDACAFLFHWFEQNMKQFLRDGNRSEECPIAKGDFSVNNYLVNYDELPQEMVYGDFKARVVFIQNGEEIFCFYCYFLSKAKKGI